MAGVDQLLLQTRFCQAGLFKSLCWVTKSLQILRRRPQGGDRGNYEKTLLSFSVSMSDRSRGFSGCGHTVGVAGPKVWILLSERDIPKGHQSKQTKNNRCGHDTFSKHLFEIAKVSRHVASGGFGGALLLMCRSVVV